MMKITVIASTILFLALAAASQVKNEARTMTYIKFHFEGPDMVDYDTIPREIWRIDRDELRMIEPLDTINQLQTLMIYNPPSFWMINLFDSTGIHGIDPGPSLHSVAPVFGFEMIEEQDRFELGFEIQYIDSNSIEPFSEILHDGIKAKLYKFNIGDAKITLLIGVEERVPLKASLKRGDNENSVVFDKYIVSMQPDSNLFIPPKWAKLREAE